MRATTMQDAAAGFVSGLACAGIIVLAAIGKEPPPSLTMVLGSSLTWLYIRSTDHKPRPYDPNRALQYYLDIVESKREPPE